MFKNVSIDKVLELCFKNQPFTYAIVNNTIVVKEKPKDGEEIYSVSMLSNLPNHEVHGRVLNQDGQAVPGITVTVKGSSQVTTTDEKGEFVVNNVSDNTVLIFTAVNVEKLETVVGDRTNMTLTLKIKRSLLDDVQIIGYGSTSRRLNTGSQGSVTSC